MYPTRTRKNVNHVTPLTMVTHITETKELFISIANRFLVTDITRSIAIGMFEWISSL